MTVGRSKGRGTIRIGCSGWQYRHWRGSFYPEGLPTSRWLEHYASELDTVEVNGSFYRLPEVTAVAEWHRRTPPGFLFAWKASRFLTHMKKLKDPDEPIARMLERARPLGRKLGPILYQLPPHWTCNEERLATFLDALPSARGLRLRHAFEMRDESWYTPGICALLEAHGAALCLHDMEGSAPSPTRVGPFAYVRFHGAPGEGKYGGRYPIAVLRAWAARMRAWAGEGADVYAYFNNDVGGHAPRDAARLRALLA